MLIKATRENLAKVNEAVEDFLADKPISFTQRIIMNCSLPLSTRVFRMIRLQSPIPIQLSAPRKDRSEDLVFFL